LEKGLKIGHLFCPCILFIHADQQERKRPFLSSWALKQNCASTALEARTSIMSETATWQAIDAALGVGDMHGAARLANVMLAAGHRDPMLLNLAAWAREEAGAYAEAHVLLGEALTLAPNDPLIHLSIGAVMRKEGRLDEAFAIFARVAPALSDNPAYWLERGYAYEAVGAHEAAAADLERAVQLDQASAPPMAALAQVFSRIGRIGDARNWAERTLRLDSHNPTATIALARCDFEDGAHAKARAALTALIARDNIHIADQVIAYGLLGDVHDRLNAPVEAFAAYSAANTRFSEQHSAHFGPNRAEPLQSAFVASIKESLGAIDPTLWKSSMPAHLPHAFLLGYPRSGTTLVENILASVAGVEALEEKPTLAKAAQDFLQGDGGLARFVALDDGGLQPLIEAYWAQVRRYGVDPAGGLFVDMDPLKGIMLPLIAKMFPDAKIIVMRRDPRDVVWSCFRTNFALSAAAMEFTSLESTAHHYDALMRMMERCFEVLPLQVHELRYDALVQDFDATTKALCDFLELEWSPEMRQFNKTAERRGVATASAAQVRRGLYDGTKQWERYKTQMEPVLPILQPWVERFGFGA
jgi:tetratricopeptide (TPR) repeat protein